MILEIYLEFLHFIRNLLKLLMISCKDCDASYVEQISRQLKTKISEHKNHIRVDVEIRLHIL